MKRPLIPVWNALALVFAEIANRAMEAAEWLQTCPRCGQSQYYGRPCVHSDEEA